METFICNQYRERLAILNNEKMKIYTKVVDKYNEAINMLFVCIFFRICQIWCF